MCGKDCIWNPAACSCDNGKYLASFIDDSLITCDKIIEEIKTIPTNFNEKLTCKPKKYILLAFLLITMTLLTVVSIEHYLIKYKAKQNH